MSNEIDNINIEYSNSIDSIDVQYTNEIETIVLSLGADAQSVFSINGLTGNITLTASATLPSISASVGIYSYTINHNLNYSTPIVSLYNTSNSLVISDVELLNANNVKIKSVIDLSGYKVVIQR